MSDARTSASVSRAAEPLYVGYRPLPARDRAALMVIIPSLAIALGVLGGAIAGSQRNPGPGAWHADVRTFVGSLYTEPYPILVVDGRPHLLVAEGKHGVLARVRELNAATAQVRGTLIERDGRRLIEVASTADAIARGSEATKPDLAPAWERAHAAPRPISILAEIVDGKCYLGAMKPGNAKGHKACATLCIEGGLPPLVIELKSLGSQFTCPPTSVQPDEIFPVLRVDGSMTLPPEVLAMVGEPVRITGTLTTVHGVPVIDTTAVQITRSAK